GGRDGAAGDGEGQLGRLGLVRRVDLQLGRGRRLARRRRVVLGVGHPERRAGLGAGRERDQGGGPGRVAGGRGADLGTRRIGEGNARESVNCAGGRAAVSDFTVLEFTNGGSSACTIYGFPGVSLTNSAGAQIGAAATRNPSRASTLITLAPGAKLKVYPPNQTQSAELPFTVTGCAVSATHQLSVTAVTAGAGQTVP